MARAQRNGHSFLRLIGPCTMELSESWTWTDVWTGPGPRRLQSSPERGLAGLACRSNTKLGSRYQSRNPLKRQHQPKCPSPLTTVPSLLLLHFIPQRLAKPPIHMV